MGLVCQKAAILLEKLKQRQNLLTALVIVIKELTDTDVCFC